MNAPVSSPRPSNGQRVTAQGTIVGMPAVVRLSEELSTTLRSARDSDFGPISDAFHPERWSDPPPTALSPIIPCEEPEEDDVVRVLQRLEPADSTPVVRAEAPFIAPDEPVVLPMGHRESDRGIWLSAVVVCLLALAAVASTFVILR